MLASRTEDDYGIRKNDVIIYYVSELHLNWWEALTEYQKAGNRYYTQLATVVLNATTNEMIKSRYRLEDLLEGKLQVI